MLINSPCCFCLRADDVLKKLSCQTTSWELRYIELYTIKTSKAVKLSLEI